MFGKPEIEHGIANKSHSWFPWVLESVIGKRDLGNAVVTLSGVLNIFSQAANHDLLCHFFLKSGLSRVFT